MNKGIKLVLFDLDGVLIDSKKNMELSWKKVQKNFNLKIPFSSYFKHIGLPFEKILQRLHIKKDKNKIYKTYQNESIKQFSKIKLYSGINKVLKKLIKKKISLGIVTSKDKIRTLKLVRKFNMNIRIIVSPSKSLKGKPYPDQLIEAMRKAKIKSANTIYVGDMLVDYKIAKNSGVNFVYTGYGYGSKKKFYKYSIKKFNDLYKFI